MNRSDIGVLIDKIGKSNVLQGSSIILNLEFPVCDGILHFKPVIDDIFHHVETWGFMRKYMKQGPGMIFQTKEEQHVGFSVYDKDNSYVEAFRVIMVYGSGNYEGYGTLQYSSSEKDRVNDLLTLLLSDDNGYINMVSHLICADKSVVASTLKSSKSSEVMRHFDLYPDRINRKRNSLSHPYFDIISDHFKFKGWSLNKTDRNPTDEAIGGYYQIDPTLINNNSDIPSYEDGSGRQVHIGWISLGHDAAFLYLKDANKSIRVRYSNIEGTIKRCISTNPSIIN